MLETDLIDLFYVGVICYLLGIMTKIQYYKYKIDRLEDKLYQIKEEYEDYANRTTY